MLWRSRSSGRLAYQKRCRSTVIIISMLLFSIALLVPLSLPFLISILCWKLCCHLLFVISTMHATLYSHLNTILSSFGLSQVVPCSTRTSTCGRSTLAVVSDPLSVTCCAVPPIGNSDHLGVHLNILCSLPRIQARCRRLVWRYALAECNA